jgi:hypothetical protein
MEVNMYRRDDGSMTAGILITIAVIAAFGLGYRIRDQGVILKITIPQPTQEIQTK